MTKKLDKLDLIMVCMNLGNGMTNAESDNEIKVCSKTLYRKERKREALKS
jgi:hypothetical protein